MQSDRAIESVGTWLHVYPFPCTLVRSSKTRDQRAIESDIFGND